METRTSKFLKNSVFQFVYQVALMITGFILPRVMLVNYGSEVNGLVSSISQFINYFALVEAGLSAATIYSLYAPLAEHDRTKISNIVCASRDFYRQSGYIFIALLVVLAGVYPLLVKSNVGLNYPEMALLVVICGFSGVADFFVLSKYRSLFTADQKSYVICIALTASTICNVLIVTIFANAGFSVTATKAVALLAILIRSVILVGYAKKYYSYIDYKAKPNKSALDKRWDALFQQILSMVQLGAPTVILTLINGDLKLVSVHAIFLMITSGLDSVLGIFISGLSASFGEVIVKKEDATLKNAFKQFETSYYILITSIYTIALVLIMPFIRIYTAGITDTDYSVVLYGILYIINGFMYNLKTPHGMLVLSAGLYKETRYRSLTQALIAVILGVILAKPFGIIGVMLAMIASNLYRCIDLLLFIPKHVTHISPRYTLSQWVCMFPLIIAGIAVALFDFINVGSYLQWALVGVVLTMLVSGIVLSIFTIFYKNEVKQSFNRVIMLIKRENKLK
ncbi:MAG: hypothetical protein PHV32_08010 [Eubacteriales bacterium]|nr:hypothetical protein [Eubacteriales bacterium]